MRRRDTIAADLNSEDPEVRAAAIGEVGMLALGYPPILRAMVDMTADQTPLPEGSQPRADDPFASFFGAETAKRTFGEQATAQIFAAGLPGHHIAVETLVSIVADSAEPTAWATVARLLAETRWEDPEAAARALIGPLHQRDVSLAPVIAGADAITLEILVGSAVSPYRSRAINELMNDGAARAITATAILGILDDLDDDHLAEALAVLISWDVCEIDALRTLESARPWVVKFTAIVDPRASDRGEAFVGSIPEGALIRLHEVIGLVHHAPDDAPTR